MKRLQFRHTVPTPFDVARGRPERSRGPLAGFAGVCIALALQGVGHAQSGVNIWVQAGEMSTPRVLHSATRLANGQVLVAGGRVNLGDTNAATRSVDIFSPGADAWSAGPLMALARAGHTATLLQDGRVVVAGGCTLGFSYFCDATTASTEIYDPATGAWTTVAAMATERWGHQANLLPSGEVLVTGGANNCGSSFCDVIPDAEIFNPQTNSWRPAAPMALERFAHATMGLLDGRLLATGGCLLDIPDACDFPQAGTEIYDPASDSWTPTGALTPPRTGAPLALLPGGDVLLSGGVVDFLLFSAAMNVYQVSPGQWSAAGSMILTRGLHSATVLADGRVLVAGGQSAVTFGEPSSELYNPSTQASGLVGSLITGRSLHTATLLLDGRVLVAGGETRVSSLASSAEIFLPGTTPLLLTVPDSIDFGSNEIGVPSAPRTLTLSNPSPVSLSIASIEVTGSNPQEFTLTGSCGTIAAGGSCDLQIVFEASSYRTFQAAITISSDAPTSPDTVSLRGSGFFDTADFWTQVGSMGTPRSDHTATLLRDGRVLVTGGRQAGAQLTAEIYSPATSDWSPAGGLGTPRAGGHTATRLSGGRVLVAGGATSAVEIFDPGASFWTPGPAMSTPRTNHTATLLRSGALLVAGGGAGAEIFNPSTNAWSPTLPPRLPRSAATATLLPNGDVLVAGGLVAGFSVNSAEVYSPATNRWTPVARMNTARAGHFATLLPDGSVLVFGGGSGAAERYVPSMDSWLPAQPPALVGARFGAARMAGGRVFATGGIAFCDIDIGCFGSAAAEMYDVQTDAWQRSANMHVTRDSHTVTLLRNGQILVAGGVLQLGFGQVQPLRSAEVYTPQTPE